MFQWTIDLVPRIVPQLRRRVPEVQVKLRDMSTREQLAGLSSGAIDIGFVRLPVGGDFEQLPVIPDSLASLFALARAGAGIAVVPISACRAGTTGSSSASN